MSQLAQQIPSYAPALRRFKDRLATATITAGGGGVLFAILLIFFYLMYEVLPLFDNAKVTESSAYQWSSQDLPLYIAMEEQGEVGLAIGAGEGYFFDIDSGSIGDRIPLGDTTDPVTAVAPESADSPLLSVGHTTGKVSLIKHSYLLSYPDDQRLITPRVELPYPDQRFSLGNGPIEKLAVRDSEDALVLVGQLSDGKLMVQRYNKEIDFLSEEMTLEQEVLSLPPLTSSFEALYVGSDQRWLYLLEKSGSYTIIDLKRTDEDQVLRVAVRGNLFKNGGELASSEMLLGGISLLVASDRGELVQFFMAREDGKDTLAKVRSFETGDTTIHALIPEHRRKGFLALGNKGQLQIYHSTAHRTLLSEQLASGSRLAI